MMTKPKCPKCQSSIFSRYVCDMSGEVIGVNLFCTECPWAQTGGH